MLVSNIGLDPDGCHHAEGLSKSSPYLRILSFKTPVVLAGCAHITKSTPRVPRTAP